jgi:uncharacterized protein (TIGR03437 family)
MELVGTENQGMGMGRLSFLLVLFCGAVVAAPVLRLENSVVYLSTAVGSAASSRSLRAFNIGDGSLSLSVSTPPSITWLTVSVGTTQTCSLANTGCIPLQFSFNTASLPRGTYTAQVTVSDPHVVDAPQVITVTVQVGGYPTSVDRYVAPGTAADIEFSPLAAGAGTSPFSGPSFSVKTSTQDGGTWLSIAEYGQGSLQFLYSYYIHLAPPANMAPGTYSGSVAITDSIDNRTIPVTMHVTTKPIAAPSVSSISLRRAQSGPAVTYPFLPFISLAASGLGTLVVQDVTSAGPGVSAYDYAGLGIVTVDPASLALGTYADGAVTFKCNAANCPIQVPVSLEVVPQGPPLATYQGVVDNVTFSPGFAVAPGDVAVLRGEQLSLSPPAFADAGPLPVSLGGANVLVNGAPAHLYYSSYGQIAFQVPTSTPVGMALVQVVRDGLAGNTVSVYVVQSAPQIVVVTDAQYNVRDATHPAKPGDTVIFWTIGLGLTNPPVPDGAVPPAGPPAMATVPPRVHFSSPYGDVTPSFAGLSGTAGLYEVIVAIPASTPAGAVFVALETPNWTSNFMPIAVQ